MISILLVILVVASGVWATKSYARRELWVVCFSLLLVLAWNWTLAARLPDIVRNDTILTLSVINGVLLFMLTLTMSVFCAWLSMVKTRYFQKRYFQSATGRIRSWLMPAVRDLVLTFASFWLALMLVPQLFYLFYRIIIPGLPLQWVITPLTFQQISQFLIIDQSNTLSALSTGLLFSTLLVAVVWSWLLVCPLGKDKSEH